MHDKNMSTDIDTEIEVVKAVASVMQKLDRGAVKFVNHPKPVFVLIGEKWEKRLM